MYESFFGLTHEPFSIAPDPRFLYMSAKHREALAHLGYGLRRGTGFVLLTGEIGAGKTTVLRSFIEQLPSNFDVANVVNPRLGVSALLTRVCEDLRIELPAAGAPNDLIDEIHGHLLLSHATGRRTLIVVDEAQALSADVLEQLRLLTNLDTSERKLQVLLIGQPELRKMLEQPAFEPLAQRVVARYHLPALAEAETTRYIAHRLSVAGMTGDMPFDPLALARIHQLCRGVPRRINVLCDRAMLTAQTVGQHRIDQRIVDHAAAEVFGRRSPTTSFVPTPPRPAAARWPRWFAMASVIGIAAVAGTVLSPVLGPKLASAIAALKGPSQVPTRAAPPAAAPGPMPAAAPASALASVPPTPVAPAPAPTVTTTATGAAPMPVAHAPDSDLGAVFSMATSDEAQAWRALASLWGVSLGAGEPCAAAALQGLHCYRSRAGLAPIRQLGRPGIVTVSDERGRVAHVLLTGLSDQSATLRLGNAEHKVPLVLLARAWRGEFATLWRAPPGYREGEVVTDVGSLAPWLRQRLAAADDTTTPPAGDDTLYARVFAFQLAQGLQPDGLAGPLTLMQLNRASGIDEPRLKTAR
ncbi:ExeA family protein [Piscinibacter sp.]|uniref:ExeA family protein n=1 Tax=Piscinibacter sp. TaxID=1903157 RepID=UPI002B8454DA|nr:AAA family ATPase [Albitalea sp.]HUG26419.1 AAA family ATPase [Albitalea sp.]